MADIPATVVDGAKELALRAAANTDTVNPAVGRCLVVTNGSGGPVTVSVPALYDDDTTADDVIATVPAGETWVVPVSAFSAGPDGTVNLEYSATASVTVGQVDFPRVGSAGILH